MCKWCHAGVQVFWTIDWKYWMALALSERKRLKLRSKILLFLVRDVTSIFNTTSARSAGLVCGSLHIYYSLLNSSLQKHIRYRVINHTKFLHPFDGQQSSKFFKSERWTFDKLDLRENGNMYLANDGNVFFIFFSLSRGNFRVWHSLLYSLLN